MRGTWIAVMVASSIGLVGCVGAGGCVADECPSCSGGAASCSSETYYQTDGSWFTQVAVCGDGWGVRCTADPHIMSTNIDPGYAPNGPQCPTSASVPSCPSGALQCVEVPCDGEWHYGPTGGP